MTELPASIEQYLLEAGFSGSEIAVLRKLLQEDALTVRELASKTGKSTGVLDIAVKKLVKKGILSKESINESAKYLVRSLDAVVKWMEEDTKMKQEMIIRRQENFQTFVRSITLSENNTRRPEMEYFEGEDGLKKAYMQVLNRGNDIAMLAPIEHLAEEDPLRDFKVQWFRERQRRGIFLRVIAHDTPLGRRFQSRDPFEYRRTILVDEEAYPFQFEKMIVGDTIACFQPAEQRAVFVRYPEYAEGERVFFERLWNKKIQRETEERNRRNAEESDKEESVTEYTDVIVVPFATKTLSSVREFFLGRKSIAILAGFAVLSGLLTYGLYLRDVSLNTKRVQERALSIAATGALQFDPADLNQLRSLKDIDKPEYKKVIYQLNLIRSLNPGVRYAYIMRPTSDPNMLEFVADADALSPYQLKDLDYDGKIGAADELPSPGRSYDIKDFEPMQRMFIIGEPTADKHPETDQWGTFLSGYGPIKDANGKVVALFGVDIEAVTVHSLSTSILVLILVFVALFALCIFIRLLAFNRSLYQEISHALKLRQNMLYLAGGLLISVVASIALYQLSVAATVEEIRERVVTIATTGALQFSPSELQELRSLRDVEKPVYTQVIEKLHRIRSGNADIKYVYLIRPKPNTTAFEFIAEADGYGRDLRADNDINSDGVSDASDEIGYPGLPYDIAHVDILTRGSYFTPVATEKPYTDKWGTVLTGYAPIKTEDGLIAGLLAVDVDALSIYAPNLVVFFPVIGYLLAIIGYFLIWSPHVRSSLLYSLAKRLTNRTVITRIGLILVLLYWLGFGLYQYTQHLIVQEKGKRLVAIASTAASQINPDDLTNIHFARDMKTPEYQRVFHLLNDVRNNNPGIEYVYILRPTETEGIWEFVVDADANYYVPFIEWDYTGDGIIDESDENISPGVYFDVAFFYPKVHKRGLYEAVFENSLIPNQWGSGYSGFAPILKNGKPIAVLGVDDEVTYELSLYDK